MRRALAAALLVLATACSDDGGGGDLPTIDADGTFPGALIEGTLVVRDDGCVVIEHDGGVALGVWDDGTDRDDLVIDGVRRSYGGGFMGRGQGLDLHGCVPPDGPETVWLFAPDD